MIGRTRRRRHEEDDAVPPARRRFEPGRSEEVAAGGAGCRCRSCAAVAVADCVALGCCPCAVLGLLGLALVRAPLAVARRLVTRRRCALLRGKRVRDVAGATAAPATPSDGPVNEKGIAGVESTRPNGEERAAGSVDDHEAELAWLDEMYRTGRWGFGRVSFSAKTP